MCSNIVKIGLVAAPGVTEKISYQLKRAARPACFIFF